MAVELTFRQFLCSLGLFGVLFVGNGIFLVKFFVSAIYKVAHGVDVAEIKKDIFAIRCLARVLPAIGLLGTLAGMNLAFRMTEFSGESASLTAQMDALMHNFSLALFTTIVGVIGKICADLFCHFAIERPIMSRG